MAIKKRDADAFCEVPNQLRYEYYFVDEFFAIENGVRVGRCKPKSRLKSCVNPPGYYFEVRKICFHPVTRKSLGSEQRWLYLIPYTVAQIVAHLYLSKIEPDEAVFHLKQQSNIDLAEAFLDCIQRGNARPLFCNTDGEAFHTLG